MDPDMKPDAVYHILLEGPSDPDEDHGKAAERLSRLFKIDRETARKLLTAKRAVIKKSVDADTADALITILERACFRCRRESVGGEEKPVPEETFECPKCGHTCCLDGKFTTGDTCPSCNVVVEKYLKRLKADDTDTDFQVSDADGEPEPGSGPVEEDNRNEEGVFPKWVSSALKWLLSLFGAWLLVQTGISVFEISNYEMLYNLHRSEQICVGSPLEKYHPELRGHFADNPMAGDPDNLCLYSFKIHLLNSGRKTQPQTVIRMRMPAEGDRRLTDAPLFLDFDRAQRQGIQIRVRGDVTSYALGPMKPADQLFVRFKMIVPRDDNPDWDAILEKIDIARGELKSTDSPRLTMMTRILLSLFGAFDMGARDAAEELVDIFLEDDADRSREITREFDMASADLTTEIEADGYRPGYAGETALHYITYIWVFNNGPANADSVKLRYTIPDSVEVRNLSMTIEGYQPRMYELLQESRQRYTPGDLPKECVETPDGVTCTIATLGPEKAVTLRLEVLDHAPGEEPYHAEAESGRSDPDEADNSFSYRVTPPASGH